MSDTIPPIPNSLLKKNTSLPDADTVLARFKDHYEQSLARERQLAALVEGPSTGDLEDFGFMAAQALEDDDERDVFLSQDALGGLLTATFEEGLSDDPTGESTGGDEAVEPASDAGESSDVSGDTANASKKPSEAHASHGGGADEGGRGGDGTSETMEASGNEVDSAADGSQAAADQGAGEASSEPPENKPASKKKGAKRRRRKTTKKSKGRS